jgi:hypothetical protein
MEPTVEAGVGTDSGAALALGPVVQELAAKNLNATTFFSSTEDKSARESGHYSWQSFCFGYLPSLDIYCLRSTYLSLCAHAVM